MTNQKPWNKFEAVVLLDNYLAYVNGNLTRKAAIELTSIELRKIANNQHIEIDNIFRNENGITFQMHSMESAYRGYTCVKPASKLFIEIVDIYKNDITAYKNLLKEARKMISNTQSNKDTFFSWISKKVSPAQLSELYIDYQTIDEFCIKHKFLGCSFFDTTDFNTIKRIQRYIKTNSFFRFQHKRTMNRINTAIRYYESYVDDLSKSNDLKTEKKSEDKAVSKSVETISQESFNSSDTMSNSRALNVQYEKKHPLVYAKIYEALKSTSDIVGFKGATILSIYESTRRITSCEIIKEILDNVSWANCKENKYFFVLPEKEPNLSILKSMSFDENDLVYNRLISLSETCSVDEKLSIGTISNRIGNLISQKRLKYYLDTIPWIVEGADGLYTFTNNINPVEQTPSSLEPEFNKNSIVDTESSLFVDFTNIPDLSYTKPISVSYFQKTENVSTWRQVYLYLFRGLYEDYKQVIPINKSFGTDGGRIDLGSKDSFNTMTSPKEIEKDVYLETNLSATDIVRKIKLLLDICLVDEEFVIIKYEKRISTDKSVNKTISTSKNESPINANAFYKWLIKKGMADATARSYTSSIHSAEAYAKENGIQGVCLTTNNAAQVLASIDILLANKLFIEHNQEQHNRFSAAFRKLRDYIAEVDRREAQKTSDTELEIKNPALYHKLYSVSKVFDDPQGLGVDHILRMIDFMCSKEEIIEFLDRISWATKLSEEIYSFSKNIEPVVQPFEEPKNKDVEPTDFDKDAFICVLMSRYQSGMQFDSIDLENFRDTYEDMHDEKLEFTDEELEARLKCCGILYKDRLFPAEGIIDNGTKERLFAYIENKFAAGNKVLYYKAIFSDLSDAFAYCFSLTDEQMLRAYLEHTAEKGKYFFHSSYMSVEKNVKIDHSAEIEDFMLAAGKPLSYDDVYEGLSHISKDVIYREIRIGSKFIMNEKEHYFHIDIFEFSPSDREKIAEILYKEISDNGYAIWSRVFEAIQEQMPIFIDNNLYLSSLGIRNALSIFMANQFHFDGEVISTKDVCLSMADVYQLFAKHHAPFTDDDIYEFSREVGTPIYFWALAEETVRVSRCLFVTKNQIEFDVEATDKALETYLSSGYILVKDVDSFLVFPNVGYEWNEFLLESYLLHYSKKFCLVNNGTSLNNVAGAVAKKDGNFTQFVDICAQALADSGIELKKAVALNYLAEINLITRRSYKELDTAMTKARQIRNQKG